MAAQLAARDAQLEAVQQDLFPERETLYATQCRAKRLVTGLRLIASATQVPLTPSEVLSSIFEKFS